MCHDNKIFVMWKWTWLDAADIPSSDRKSEDNISELDCGQLDLENPDYSEDEPDDVDGIPVITHSFVFKCTKEDRCQELRALVNRKITRVGVTIPIKLQPIW